MKTHSGDTRDDLSHYPSHLSSVHLPLIKVLVDGSLSTYLTLVLELTKMFLYPGAVVAITPTFFLLGVIPGVGAWIWHIHENRAFSEARDE